MASRRSGHGFTLIEVLVVLSVISLLITISVPYYLERIEQARETALRENLRVIRGAIDRFHSDSGRFPASLEELVERRYLRDLPVDPVTGRSDTWVIEASTETEAAQHGMADVRSGAEGQTRKGVPYEAL